MAQTSPGPACPWWEGSLSQDRDEECGQLGELRLSSRQIRGQHPPRGFITEHTDRDA